MNDLSRRLRLPLLLSLAIILSTLATAPAARAAQDAAQPLPPAEERGSVVCSQAKSQWFADHGDEIMNPLYLSPGQENFDVTYYDLALAVQTTLPRRIFGTLTMKAKAVSAALDSCVLDFKINMTVTSVTSGGVPATYTRSGTASTMTIALDRTYSMGEIFEIVVVYEGSPSGALTVSSTTSGLIISSLSEPYGARSWWPCKDWPEDKADSVDLHYDVPSGYIVAANGTLTGMSDNGTRAVYDWSERYPISTYLVSIAAHPYARYNDWYHYGPTDSMEVQFYVYPPDSADSAPVNAKVVSMIEAFAGYFGEYPFLNEKYGQAQFSWGGAMEHQTCTSTGGWWETVTAHELAHQWWGDLVTCENFHHVWLNEGFASYGESLWWETRFGMDGYHAYMDGQSFWNGGTIYVEDELGGGIFSSIVYDKGSWVLHMLRGIVGETVFFDILHTYYNDSKAHYGTATTEEFEAICESVSGLDLSDFFSEWIYGEYYPVYQYAWDASDAGGGAWEVDLHLDQVQSWQLFHMPVRVAIGTTAGDTTIVVDDASAHEEYTLTVNAEPLLVEIDPDHWILREVEELATGVDAGETLSSRPRLALQAPQPNPFHPDAARPGAAIDFAVPSPARATLRVLDVNGRVVTVLHDGLLAAGPHTVRWNGRDASGAGVPAGVYFYELATPDGRRVQKSLLIR